LANIASILKRPHSCGAGCTLGGKDRRRRFDHSLPAGRIIRVLDAVAATRGYPAFRRVDNGPKFISQALDAWTYQHHVKLVFIAPGKPIQNAHVESFNGRVRDEFLNEHWFATIAEAQVLAEAFRIDFNTIRPHTALKNRTPEEFVASWAASPAAPVRPQDQEQESTAPEVTQSLDRLEGHVSALRLKQRCPTIAFPAMAVRSSRVVLAWTPNHV